MDKRRQRETKEQAGKGRKEEGKSKEPTGEEIIIMKAPRNEMMMVKMIWKNN